MPCLASVLLAAGPATGARWSAPDPAGDAIATTYSVEPEPCGPSVEEPHASPDLRRLVVRHTRERLLLRARVDGLEGVRHASVSFAVKTRRGLWTVDVDRSAGWFGAFVADLTGFDVPEDPCATFGILSAACGRAGLDRETGIVWASLPERCVGRPSAVRVGAVVSGYLRDGALASDSWSPTAGHVAPCSTFPSAPGYRPGRAARRWGDNARPSDEDAPVPRLRAVLATVLCLAVVGLPAGAASATRWSAPDPAGDALTRTYTATPRPCGTARDRPAPAPDLRRLTARHGPHRLTFTARVDGLADVRLPTVTFWVKTRRDDWVVETKPTSSRDPFVFVGRLPAADPGPDACGYVVYDTSCRRTDVRVRRATGTVTISVPRRCLDTPRAVRTGVSVTALAGRRSVLDRWSSTPGRTDGPGLLPPLGPRLPAGPTR